MKQFKYAIDDTVRVNEKSKLGVPNYAGRIGQIYSQLVTGSYDYEVQFDNSTLAKFKENELDGYFGGEVESSHEEMGRFTEIAYELGQFTDEKNRQYGSSVDATFEMIKVLMERYTYNEENYLMPKSLLQHILLQVRMMDKINRIFNNPSGKGDSESPYKDLVGYSLIGVDMVERNK